MSAHRCGTCGFSWDRDNGRVSCGAPVDDGALLGVPGVNAIWAERKYSPFGLLAAVVGDVNPEGTDCENLDPNDGELCKMWKPRPTVSTPTGTTDVFQDAEGRN
jgi:hypothetical protein